MPCQQDITNLFARVAQGVLSPEEAAQRLRFLPFERTLDGVAVDNHRSLRTGQGETVLAEGKTLERLLSAVAALSGESRRPVLVTRASAEQGEALLAAFPQGEYWEQARLFSLGRPLNLAPPWPDAGRVVVVTAGASDMGVALEALGTLRFHGVTAALAPDVGVAGLHRIRPWLPALDAAAAVIVVAGMEGALPSVVAGLIAKPVLAVPASVGYGVAKGGYAALLGMLASCSPGIAVLNIDNGYGAAMFAARIQDARGNPPPTEAP